MTDLLTDTDFKPTTATRPPSKWRNRWQANCIIILHCRICNTVKTLRYGEIFETHCRIYPSRDVAETHARLAVGAHYLGPFPLD